MQPVRLYIKAARQEEFPLKKKTLALDQRFWTKMAPMHHPHWALSAGVIHIHRMYSICEPAVPSPGTFNCLTQTLIYHINRYSCFVHNRYQSNKYLCRIRNWRLNCRDSVDSGVNLPGRACTCRRKQMIKQSRGGMITFHRGLSWNSVHGK